MNWGRFSKTFAFWILILLIPVALIQLSGARGSESPKINYTQYREQLNRDNIRAVTIQGGKYIQGEFRARVNVQGRDVRKASVDADGQNRESYQGVAFVEGPVGFRLGDTARFVLELMYYPEHRYEDVRPGATFTVREGGKIVAHGIVVNRNDPAG